jgi:hypothetical protein
LRFFSFDDAMGKTVVLSIARHRLPQMWMSFLTFWGQKMLVKEGSKNRNHQELVQASIDALVKALEAGHTTRSLPISLRCRKKAYLEFPPKTNLD